MKKTIMASSLAVALGVTGYAAGTGLHGHGAMKQLMVKLLVSQTLQVQTTLLHTTKVQMYNQ